MLYKYIYIHTSVYTHTHSVDTRSTPHYSPKIFKMVPQELHFLADASAFMLPGPAQAQDEEEDDEEVEGHGKHNQLNTWVILPRYPGTMR